MISLSRFFHSPTSSEDLCVDKSASAVGMRGLRTLGVSSAERRCANVLSDGDCEQREGDPLSRVPCPSLCLSTVFIEPLEQINVVANTGSQHLHGNDRPKRSFKTLVDLPAELSLGQLLIDHAEAQACGIWEYAAA
jgi:hypothetical protein